MFTTGDATITVTHHGRTITTIYQNGNVIDCAVIPATPAEVRAASYRASASRATAVLSALCVPLAVAVLGFGVDLPDVPTLAAMALVWLIAYAADRFHSTGKE